MIQLSNNITMFAAFTARTIHTIICDGHFYGHSGTLYPNDIRLSNPHGLLSHDSNLFLPERGEGNLSLFIILCNFSFMARTMKICNAGNNSTRKATSTHETRVSKLKPSQTIAERQSLILFFRDKYPEIRKMKIRQTGHMLIARARAGKRCLHAGAFSLKNIYAAFDNECRIKLS